MWVQVFGAASSIVRIVMWYLDRRDARARGETPTEQLPPV